jgi:hypothetical protein
MSATTRRAPTRAVNAFDARVRICISFEEEELEMLRAYTRDNCMSMSNFVRRLVKRYVETHQAPRARRAPEEP